MVHHPVEVQDRVVHHPVEVQDQEVIHHLEHVRQERLELTLVNLQEKVPLLVEVLDQHM